MKKTMLMLAFTGLMGAAFAFSGGQDGNTAAKKSCNKEKHCCKKGESGKACDKKQGEKTEAKANTETKQPEVKK